MTGGDLDRTAEREKISRKLAGQSGGNRRRRRAFHGERGVGQHKLERRVADATKAAARWHPIGRVHRPSDPRKKKDEVLSQRGPR